MNHVIPRCVKKVNYKYSLVTNHWSIIENNHPEDNSY